MRGPFIGIIGAGACDSSLEELATEVGREVARREAVLICGGLGGGMTAAAKGAKEVGGITIGILPGGATSDANVYIDYPIATNMGQARNAVIVQTADVLIGVDGSYGTLSEIAMALKIGKPVIVIHCRFSIPGVHKVQTPIEAVDKALASLQNHSPPTLSI